MTDQVINEAKKVREKQLEILGARLIESIDISDILKYVEEFACKNPDQLSVVYSYDNEFFKERFLIDLYTAEMTDENYQTKIMKIQQYINNVVDRLNMSGFQSKRCEFNRKGVRIQISWEKATYN